MDDAIYKKSGSAGAEGVDYQLNLLLMTLLRAEDKYGDNFRLYSEWEKAGKFDDLVLTYKDHQNVQHHHLLQAKHVIDEQKTITYEDLISGDKFSIEKYFNSFKEIEKNFKGEIDDLILFSNLALNENVRPFVDPIPIEQPLFHFHEHKKDGKLPVMHRLNSKFIEEYQYSKLRRIARTFLDYCFKGIEMKATNNVFKDCHVILSTNVVNISEGKFRFEFIDGEDLSVETRQFRDILLEELERNLKTISSAETQTEWLRNMRMKFTSGFGICSSKKKAAVMWPIALISSDDVELFKNFCKLFILASSQPNDKELTAHSREEYINRHSKSQGRLATDFLQNKLRNWFKTEASAPLNSTFLKDAMKYIINNEKELKYINETERNIQALSPLQLKFESIPYEDQIGTFLQQNESSVLHIKAIGNMKVSLMKLFNCLQKLQLPGYFFGPKEELSKMIDLLEVFEDSETFHILIIELPGINNNKDLMEKLQYLIQNDATRRKKIIVVTKKEEAVVDPNHLFLTVEDATYFEHLTRTSRQQLLNRKITFQGTEIVIKSILSNGIPLTHNDIQSWECLVVETISINSNRDDIDLGYYINRTLHCECPYFDKNTIQERLGDQHIVTYNITDFERALQLHSKLHVHRLQEVDGLWYWRSSNSGVKDLLKQEKGTRELQINDNDDNFLEYVNETLIISDPAGNGKTTTSSYLATELLRKNRHYWVTRLPSSRCSFTSEEIHLTAASDNIKYDSFLMEKLFEVSTPLERLIFGQYLKEEESQSKLLFIFDGLDEINAESRTVIIRALKYLKEKPNVKFIGISTRPQHLQQLEEELHSRTWTLRPFNEHNKITFLEKFWSSRAATEQCDKLRGYAERLIASISRSISEKESELTGVPLQMRMIGEIYAENAKELVTGDIEQDIPFTPIDLFQLYEQFIKKKEDLYLNEKLGFNQSAAQRSVTIKPFQQKQIEFALETMLGSDVENIEASGSASKLPLSEGDLEDCIGLGIIQKSENKKYSFIHRTFAEFLTAKYLLDANESVTNKLKNGQLMRVLAQESCSVVRKFINSKFDFKRMVVEFTKRENEIAIQDIGRFEFLDAIKTLIDEKIAKILNFLFELLLFRIKQIKGLRNSYVKRHNRIISKAPILKWMIIENDNDVLLEAFKLLLSSVLTNPDEEELGTSVIDCQGRLQEKKIITNDKHLKSILWSLNTDDKDILFSFEYFRYLKHNNRDILYAFLKEKGTIQKIMLNWQEKLFIRKNELYQLMEGDSAAYFIFDHFVEGVLKEIPSFIDKDQFEAYFKFLSRYTRLFDRQRLTSFQQYLKWRNDTYDYSKLSPHIEILLQFLQEHRDLFSIEVIAQNLLIHKNLSFIENCVLWGWADSLKVLPAEKRRILASIRKRLTDRQLMKIARVRVKGSDMFDIQILSKAILTRDDLNLEIFSSWMTTEKLFCSFMTEEWMEDAVIEFVDKRLPQYRMKYFMINKEKFIHRAVFDCKKIIEILGNDQKVNEEEFLELMNLRNRFGRTILNHVCWSNVESLIQWLGLFRKKFSNSVNIEQLYRIVRPVLDNSLEYELNVQKQLSEFSNEINLKD